MSTSIHGARMPNTVELPPQVEQNINAFDMRLHRARRTPRQCIGLASFSLQLSSL
jgi:hypothetical protein